MGFYLNLVLLILALGLVSCTRPEGKSKVSLVLPSQMALGSKLQSSIQAMAEPTSLGEINCVAVLVGGPESFMSNNRCQYAVGSEILRFGEFHPVVSLSPHQSTELELEVASGAARVFRLFGFKSESGICPQLRSPEHRTLLSSPYDLGHSEPHDLSGALVQVTIPISFNANKEIAGCEGPLIPKSGSNNGPPSGQPYFRIEGLGLYESGGTMAVRSLTRGMCYPIHFASYNPCTAGTVCTPRALTAPLSVTFSNSTVRFFTSQSDCESDSNMASSPRVQPAGSDGTDSGNRVNLWMRIPLATSWLTHLDLKSIFTLPSQAEVAHQQGTFAVGSPQVVASDVPSALAPNTCHGQDSTWTFHESGTSSNPLGSHESIELRFPNMNFYESGSCTTPKFGILSSGGVASITGRLQKRSLAGQGFDGAVNKVLKVSVSGNDKFLVAGSYSNFGGHGAKSLVRLNLDGSFDPSFRPADTDTGGVSGLIPDGSGQFYVYGDFTNYQGTGRNYLVRIHSDGVLDGTFDIVPDGPVYAVALSGTDLFIGGYFSNLSDGGTSTTRENLALVNAANSSVQPFALGANGVVRSLLRSGNDLYVGGMFGTLGVSARNRLGRIDVSSLASPTVASWDPNVNGAVNTMVLDGSTLYIGGSFTTFGGGGIYRDRLAAIDTITDPANVLSWNPGSNGEIFSLVLDGTAIWAGGGFSTVGGQSRSLLAKIDLSNGNSELTNFNFTGSVVTSMTKAGDHLYVAGTFTEIAGNPAPKIAALDIVNEVRNTSELRPGMGSVFGLNNLVDILLAPISD